jgi:flagellar protein FliJ
MKRFRFPLQAVAVIRADREMRAREAFGHAVQAYRRSEAELAAVRERVACIEAAMAQGRQRSFSPTDEIQALVAYRQERAGEHAAEQAMLAARALMHQRRAELLDARRNVEVVARLEQKGRAAHRVACGREEQAGFDEFAARQFGRASTRLSA